MRVVADKSVAVIVDVQQRLFPHTHDHETLKANLLRLIKGLQILDIPTLITEQYTKGLGPTIDDIRDGFDEFKPIEKMSFS